LRRRASAVTKPTPASVVEKARAVAFPSVVEEARAVAFPSVVEEARQRRALGG
jgi:hypothetical protein